MKRVLLLLLCPAALAVWAQDFAPPPGDDPFEVVIEDVPEAPAPEVAPAPAPAPVAAPEEEASPVAEEAEETPRDEFVPNCGHGMAPPKAYDLEVLMLQIFLDRNNFPCGVIDGVWGEGTRAAMRAWQKAAGLRQTLWVDVALYQRIAEMPEACTRYTLVEEDFKRVSGPMPPTWAQRAALDQMGYESIGACVAEMFHTSERLLRRLNPSIINWPEDLRVGSVLNVPNVRNPAMLQPAHIAIALQDCLLVGYDAQGVMCLRFPCSIARNKAHLPEVGQVTIRNMAPAPNYTYDPVNYGQDKSIGKMIVPPGPRNPVGSRWIGLSLPGYGIHGTPHPNTIGRPESRGCFRLTNWNAEKLFEMVQPGMAVEIVQSLKDYTPPKSKPAPAPAKETAQKEAPDA